jgi:prepilin-type N-terminal cleavage/methylation domain-containing protein
MKIGVTLIELLVSIAIVGVLAVVVFSITRVYIYKAKAAKMAADMSQIRTAWMSWMGETLLESPKQDDPIYFVPDTPSCSGRSNPRMQNAKFLYPDYLSGILINPVTNEEYRYDNDKRGCDDPNFQNPNDPVNIATYSCTESQAEELEKVTLILDNQVDKDDGYNTGLIRWVDNTLDDPDDFRLHYFLSCI